MSDNACNLTGGFNDRIRSGNSLIGTIITLQSPASAETLSRLGFDWLWIDMEHGPFSISDVENILRAKSKDCAGIVRVPINSETWIKRVLDIGADGIIVPQVKTKEEAESAVSFAKYPPEGIRSVGPGRAACHGLDFEDYVVTANEKLSVILQVEHKVGVQNINEIISVKGIDAIIVGPYDLSASLGKLGQVTDSEVVSNIEKIKTACMDKKVPVGIFTVDENQGRKFIEEGFQLIGLNIDIRFMWLKAQECLESVRKSSVSV